jgi:16S rRNA (adenine1518-N6/adenine1519-N6)-dimethyltransferase
VNREFQIHDSQPDPHSRGPQAKKRFGQHFLEPGWADRLVQAIAARPTDRFLEIGPGPGALTLRLAPLVSHLTAVELDREMAKALTPRLPPNVALVAQDFLDFDLLALAGRDLRVAGNLPYNVSSPIIFKLLRTRRDGGRLVDATLMVQREVADRIEGMPGTKDYGTLAIFVQLRANVRRLLALPPGAFRPVPKVHSAVLRFEFRDPVVGLRDEAVFERLVRSIFTQRRKTLLNALKPFAEERAVDPRWAIGAADVDARLRPEALQLAELARLADVFVATSPSPSE